MSTVYNVVTRNRKNGCKCNGGYEHSHNGGGIDGVVEPLGVHFVEALGNTLHMFSCLTSVF
ncbi:UNVERIFIED_CONTAM: hypothetical protein Sradi_1227600 [Sesamum radiatum]|uniref:Uncharacterized protein n=1 Tax=Sesamum radiatum TaxID=300843 RepID=A0AAW2UQ42_SESRA